ncbi:MAG: PorT family protein [Chitinophagaceae bacterium]|nr:PorT family protein [Chitinophagaceae bacterium]
MRNLLAAMVAVVLSCSTLSAQTLKEKTSFGFKAGVNISTFRTAIDYQNFKPAVKLGQVFGGFVQIPVSSRFIIQPEFLYSQLGAKTESQFWGEATFRYNYFSIPVLVKYKLISTWNVFAGAEADFLIRARQKQSLKTSTITNDIKDFDFAYTAGFGTAGPRWIFDARYIHGSQDVSPSAGENTFFNQAVQLTLGYKLLKKAAKATMAK